MFLLKIFFYLATVGEVFRYCCINEGSVNSIRVLNSMPLSSFILSLVAMPLARFEVIGDALLLRREGFLTILIGDLADSVYLDFNTYLDVAAFESKEVTHLVPVDLVLVRSVSIIYG